ncbi:unnamed protein product [Arabidopsis thaliana]|uniref:Prolamin-like domain-containing protein n=1 Tax=Arabidopsis thaliana TaxID=3702 RepID=A0A5S9WR99_ARATH|nr:unnamed protein product [Arabidopsis thaliana]
MEKAILITFLIATTSMVYQTIGQEEEISPISPESLAYEPAAAYEYDHELLSHMTTRRIKFLQDCSDKMSSKCNVEMTEGLIDGKPVSEDCCVKFLKIGRECHEGLMTFVFATYELKDVASAILPRSKRMWNKCVETTAAKIGAPLAFET